MHNEHGSGKADLSLQNPALHWNHCRDRRSKNSMSQEPDQRRATVRVTDLNWRVHSSAVAICTLYFTSAGHWRRVWDRVPTSGAGIACMKEQC